MPDGGGRLRSLTPSRSLDTRSGAGASTANWGTNPGGGINFGWQVAARNGVPASGATAVVMALTDTDVAGTSSIAQFDSGVYDPAYWPSGSDLPISTKLAGMPFSTGIPTTNLFVVPIGADGRVEVSSPWDPEGTFDVLAEVLGYVRVGVTTAAGMYQRVPAMQHGQDGQLGTLTSEGVSAPAKIPGLTGMTAIADRAALRADGTVWTWDAAGVRQITGITNVADVAGPYALRRDGTVALISNGTPITVPG